MAIEQLGPKTLALLEQWRQTLWYPDSVGLQHVYDRTRTLFESTAHRCTFAEFLQAHV